MAVVTPAPRLGKFAPKAVKPVAGKARKPMKKNAVARPMMTGLINRG